MANLPPDLTGLNEVPFEEILLLLEAFAIDPDAKSANRLRAVLLDRVLHLLRRAARDEIEAEALGLHAFLDAPPGAGLADSLPEAFGGFHAIGRLLTLASRRSDRAAVDSILRSHKGRPRPLLEILAEHGEPMARQDLKERLDERLEISESHLSHLLRELEEAELVERFRPAKGREVMVELGRVGREVVDTTLMPGWVSWLVDCLEELQNCGTLAATRAELEEALQKQQPSHLVAKKLADALAALAASPHHRSVELVAAQHYKATVASAPGGERLEPMLLLQEQRYPRQLFGANR